MTNLFKSFAFFLSIAYLLSGCAYFAKMKGGKPGAKGKTSHKTPAARSPQAGGQAKPQPAADPAAQQKYYDMGMRYYSEEKYAEAKKAWQQSIQLGPRTPLASKAQEYLKKTEQVLKTLQEMEKR